jgi:hypothetical protein
MSRRASPWSRRRQAAPRQVNDTIEIDIGERPSVPARPRRKRGAAMRAADVVVQPMIGPLSNTCVLIVAGYIDRSKAHRSPKNGFFSTNDNFDHMRHFSFEIG